MQWLNPLAEYANIITTGMCGTISALSCSGMFMTIIVMITIPSLFDTSRYQQVFGSIAVAKTIGFVVMPPSFGFILTVTHGPYILLGVFFVLILLGLFIFARIIAIIMTNNAALVENTKMDPEIISTEES